MYTLYDTYVFGARLSTREKKPLFYSILSFSFPFSFFFNKRKEMGRGGRLDLVKGTLISLF